MNTNVPFVIISAERADMTQPVNDWRTASLRSQLESRDLQFVETEGAYKGVHERSFLVFIPPHNHDYTVTMLRSLARRWGQQSVLYVDANREACLLFPEGLLPPCPLGSWEAVSEEAARAAEGYTYSPDTESYYVTRRAG